MEHLRTLLVGIAVAAVAVGLTGAEASAGGWAVSTLDPLEPIVAARPATVGFTIRQHGVNPVDLDDVTVEVEGHKFPAQSTGSGHYVAAVTFRSTGTFAWRIHQGWFGPQDLGRVKIDAAAGTTSTYRWPAGVRWALPAGAAAGLAGAAAVARSSRRRRARAWMAA